MKKILRENIKLVLIASIVAIVIILIGVFVCFFNNFNVKNETELMADLKNSEVFFPYCELTIQEIEILKRKTDKENKIDTVYVKVKADNTSIGISCMLSYEMKYLLYNDGWLLEDVKRYHDGIWEVTKPTEKLVLTELYSRIPYFEENGVDFKSPELTYEDVSLDNTQTEYSIYFSCKEDKGSYIAVAEGTFCFILDANGWRCDQERSYLNDENVKLVPSSGVEGDAVQEILNGIKDGDVTETIWTGTDENLENQIATYDFECYAKYNYLTVIKHYQISYYFDNESAQWVNYSAAKINEWEEWKIASHVYEYNVELHKFMDYNQNNVIRYAIDSFDGKTLNAGVQDNEVGKESVDGYYARYYTWEVNATDIPYRYVCGATSGGLYNRGYVIVIDKDKGVFTRRMQFRNDNYYKDVKNDFEKSQYYYMEQIK